MIFLKIRLYLYGYVSGCLTQAERLILLQIECTDGIEAICPERKVVAAGLAIVHRHTVGFIQHTTLVKFQIKRACTLVGRSLYRQHISAIKHCSDTFFNVVPVTATPASVPSFTGRSSSVVLPSAVAVP